jgi:hypothetical protein
VAQLLTAPQKHLKLGEYYLERSNLPRLNIR